MSDVEWTRSAATREDVVRAALLWLDTPFHDCCDVKGAGVDCAMLCVRVFVDLGLVPPFDPRPYKPQWFMHQEEPLFLQWLNKVGARPIEVSSTLPGDIVMLNFGKHAAHGAIVIDEGVVVHAYKPLGCVMRDDRRGIAHRVSSAWSVFP